MVPLWWCPVGGLFECADGGALPAPVIAVDLSSDEDEVKQEVAAHMQAEVLKLSPADEDKVEQEAAATAHVPSHRSSGVASTTREPTHTARRTSPAVNPRKWPQ